MLLVSLDIFTMERSLSPKALVDWGWRLPFFVGAVIGLVGVCMRHYLHETPVFHAAEKEGLLVQRPLWDMLRREKRALLKGVGIYLTDAIGFNLIVIFSNFYFTQYVGLNLAQSFQLNLFTVSLVLVFIPVFAWFANRVGVIRFARRAAFLLFLGALPLYGLIGMKSLGWIYCGQGGLALLLTAYVCNMPGVLYTLFPTRNRYTGIGIVINFTVAFFGGTAPLLIHQLIDLTHQPALPASLLMGGALISYFSLKTVR